MATYDARHVAHAAVATLDCSPVEQFVIPVMLREVVVDEREKTSGYVCCDVFVVWRIEPYDSSLSIALGFCCRIMVLHFAVQSTSLEGFFIGWFGLEESFLVA